MNRLIINMHFLLPTCNIFLEIRKEREVFSPPTQLFSTLTAH